MLKKTCLWLIGSFLFWAPAFLSACPFCSSNLSNNSGGFDHGLTVGIMVTIFMLLGMIGSVVGFVVYLMIKEGNKSDRRHRLAQGQASPAPAK